MTDTVSSSTRGTNAGVPVPDHCRRCRYPLGNIPTDAPCPECGSSLRQVGPHKILSNHFISGCVAILLGGFMLVAGFSGFWPALLSVPAFGLTAVVYAHLDHRSRRRIDLPRSAGNIALSLLGWLFFLPPAVLICFVVFMSLLATP